MFSKWENITCRVVGVVEDDGSEMESLYSYNLT